MAQRPFVAMVRHSHVTGECRARKDLASRNPVAKCIRAATPLTQAVVAFPTHTSSICSIHARGHETVTAGHLYTEQNPVCGSNDGLNPPP
jgi:hypothetical protein